MAYNPKYTVAIISYSRQTKYNVTQAITKLTRQESDGEIAQRVSITMANIKVNGEDLSSIFEVRDRVYVYADDGDRNEEVFRGFIWNVNPSEKKGETISLTCYDNLIYFQESEEYQYFSAGYSTKSICNTICGKWGVVLNYLYNSITHPKLPLRGNLANIFLTDLLDEVKKKTGYKYVMKSRQDTVIIDYVGTNSTVYKIHKGTNGNAIEVSKETSMRGMVTKVVIIGKEDDNDRAQVETAVVGDTATYGTLQKILQVSSGTTLAEVKVEANELIKESGKPTQTYTVTAVDIPWVGKGDKIHVKSGVVNGYLIVKGIVHYANDKTMTLEAEAA